MCKAVAAHLVERRSGKIVNISSISAKRDPVFLPTYAAAKNALLNLTRVVAKDLGPYNVNVNAVLPGLVWTPFWERLAPMLAAQEPGGKQREPRAVFDEIAGSAVLGRPQTPEDVGNWWHSCPPRKPATSPARRSTWTAASPWADAAHTVLREGCASGGPGSG